MVMPPPGASFTAPTPSVSAAAAMPLSSASQIMRLRELRSEVQDLRTVLQNVQSGAATLADNTAYIQKTRADVAALVAAFEAEEESADTVRHLNNVWEQMDGNPLLTAPDGTYAAQDQLHYLNQLEQQIQRIEYLVGWLTIPQRLNTWLAAARPGYYIPFHLVFEDEVPVTEDRQRILNFLAFSPQTIRGGIVDAANGLIYRYNDNAALRWRSLALIVIGFIAATAAVIGSCYLQIPGWPITPALVPAFIAAWGALLVGVVVHVAVGSVKRSRTGLPPVIAMSDLTYVLDARSGQILLKLLLALIGFFGLVAAAGVANLTVFNALLLGYSLDSFVELFGTSLDQKAAGQVNLLKQQLGVSA